MTLGHEHPRPMPDAWRADAACRDADPDLFFPRPGQDVTRPLAICNTCPVRQACLDDALAHPAIEDFGIRGGLTQKARRKMHRPARRINHGTPAGYMAHRRHGEPACPACVAAHSKASAVSKMRIVP